MITYDRVVYVTIGIRQKIYVFVLANCFVADIEGNKILKIRILIVFNSCLLLYFCILVLVGIDCHCCHSASEECYGEHACYDADCIFICEFLL